LFAKKNFFGLNSRYLNFRKLFLQITVEFWVAGHLSLPSAFGLKESDTLRALGRAGPSPGITTALLWSGFGFCSSGGTKVYK